MNFLSGLADGGSAAEEVLFELGVKGHVDQGLLLLFVFPDVHLEGDHEQDGEHLENGHEVIVKEILFGYVFL